MRTYFSLNRFQRFTLGLLTVTLAIFLFNHSKLQGDIDEYTLMTIALVNHQSPDIRIEDIHAAQKLLPSYVKLFQLTADGIIEGKNIPKPGFYRANNNSVYAIHFFGYSALAAVPFYAFEKIGISVLDSFLFINLSFVFILGLSLFLFFKNTKKASLALLIFILCGGLNYLKWTSTEVMSAASLCSALLLYSTGRHLISCLLVALASMQNPPIIITLAFMPLLNFAITYQTNQDFFFNLRNQCSLPVFLSLIVGCLGLIATISFNWWAFNVPNIIAVLATNSSLISIERLVSFFLDLNQGMIIGVLGIWLALGVCMLHSYNDRRWLVLSIVTVLFSIALCVPALTATNWNSGANGMMRYVFWGSMPYLFLFFYWMREQENNVNGIVKFVLIAQLVSSWHSLTYSYTEFSHVANFFMRHFPRLINPEPEIFVERNWHQDGIMFDHNSVVIFKEKDVISKTLFHATNKRVDQQLCGEGKALSSDIQTSDMGSGWQYLNGQHICSHATVITRQLLLNTDVIQFSDGWSGIELGGGDWDGLWTDGNVSIIIIPQQTSVHASAIKFRGHYFGKNTRTRIKIGGSDMGWINLANAPIIPVQPNGQPLRVELIHEYPNDNIGTPENHDSRHLSFFLQSITILQK